MVPAQQDARPQYAAAPKRQILTVRLPAELHAEFREAAFEARTSINGLAIHAMREYLKKAGAEKT